MTGQYKTSAELKNEAKENLSGKYGGAVLICFLSALFSTTPALLLSGLPAMLFFIVSLTVSVVLGVLQLGVALFFLKIACGQPASVNDLFYGFQQQTGKAMTVSALLILVQFVCLQPYQEFMILFYSTFQTKWLIAMFISAGIGLLIYVPLSLSLSLSFYLLLDFPEKSAKDILLLSIHLMKGQKGRLFYIQLSFLPLYILCLFSFGIGLLWLEPYTQMTYTGFFLDLMRPSENTKARTEGAV